MLFDPGKQVLLGLMVKMTTATQPTMFLPRASIHSIGEDAVTVDSEAGLRDAASFARAKEVLDSEIHLKGASVLTDSGDAIGKVDRILIDDQGRIVGYDVSRGLLAFMNRKRIPPEGVISIGQDAVIVANSYAPKDADDDEDEDEDHDLTPAPRVEEQPQSAEDPARSSAGAASRVDGSGR